MPPFVIDPARLYEVGVDGTPRTDRAAPPEWLGPRHLRLLAWTALGAALTGALAGMAVLCLVVGARLWAAGFALAMLAAAPLLTVGPALDWWRHRRPQRRRHRARSADFPGGYSAANDAGFDDASPGAARPKASASSR